MKTNKASLVNCQAGVYLSPKRNLSFGTARIALSNYDLFNLGTRYEKDVNNIPYLKSLFTKFINVPSLKQAIEDSPSTIKIIAQTTDVGPGIYQISAVKSMPQKMTFSRKFPLNINRNCMVEIANDFAEKLKIFQNTK